MAFIVENGTGLPDANAFISVAYFKSYSGDHGKAIAAFSDSAIEVAIIRASLYLSESFNWQGYRVKSRWDDLQGLAWPRYGVHDKEGRWVSDSSIPREIEMACAELAFYELQNPHGLTPVYVPHSRARAIRAGSVQITYDTSDKNAYSSRPILLGVIDLVSQFLSMKSSRISGKAARG